MLTLLSCILPANIHPDSRLSPLLKDAFRSDVDSCRSNPVILVFDKKGESPSTLGLSVTAVSSPTSFWKLPGRMLRLMLAWRRIRISLLWLSLGSAFLLVYANVWSQIGWRHMGNVRHKRRTMAEILVKWLEGRKEIHTSSETS